MVPPMPTGVSEMLAPFLSVGDAGPRSPATFTPLEGITCTKPRVPTSALPTLTLHLFTFLALYPFRFLSNGTLCA